MKFLTIIFLTIFVSMQAQEEKQKKSKDSIFLEIKVENPDLQLKINNLKKQYDSELSELKVHFKEDKKILRKSYKQRLKELRKTYKQQKIKKKKK